MPKRLRASAGCTGTDEAINKTLSRRRESGKKADTKMAKQITKKQALELVGESTGQAYLDFDTVYGSFWSEPRQNGVVEYQFDDCEDEEDAGDYPWDDEHVSRVFDNDNNVLWESILH